MKTELPTRLNDENWTEFKWHFTSHCIEIFLSWRRSEEVVIVGAGGLESRINRTMLISPWVALRSSRAFFYPTYRVRTRYGTLYGTVHRTVPVQCTGVPVQRTGSGTVQRTGTVAVQYCAIPVFPTRRTRTYRYKYVHRWCSSSEECRKCGPSATLQRVLKMTCCAHNVPVQQNTTYSTREWL